MGEEVIALLLVGDQLFVQVVRALVEEHAAEIEDDGADGAWCRKRHGSILGILRTGVAMMADSRISGRLPW